jgi:hypothetical protein
MNSEIPPALVEEINLLECGAVGDGRTLNTGVLRSIAGRCQRQGGGTIRVPAGDYLTGVFELPDNTTLILEKGARLLASPRLEDHLVDGASVGLLYARNARNIVLTGEGTLDGNGSVFFQEGRIHDGARDDGGGATWQKKNGLPYGSDSAEHGPLYSPGRPGNMIVFGQCRNVRIENVRLTGAAYWTLHCADCEDVEVRGLRIENDLRHPNNDGIHLTTCRRVRVRDCRIACGDDAIAITGFREPAGEPQIAFGLRGLEGVGEEIEISDCALTSRSAAVRIGYGQNPVRDVRLKNLTIRESNRGIGIFARQADVENVRIENCRIQTRLFHGNWWGRGEPLHVSAVRFPGETRLFRVRRISMHDVELSGENASVLYAEEPGAIEDVELIRVSGNLRRGKLFEKWGGNLDARPAADSRLGISAAPQVPLWAHGVGGLSCDGCCWTLESGAGAPFSDHLVIE